MAFEPHIKADLLSCSKLGSEFQVCKKSRTVYFRRAFSPASAYGKEYFLDEYKNQYGCTYLEDEANLRQIAIRRIEALQVFLSSSFTDCFLLEIGSALGFFIEEAHKKKINVQGVEVSSYATHYTKKKKLSVFQGPFLDYPLPSSDKKCFDVICAFYVIEHMPEQKSVFQKISQSLKKGGIFYFALPSMFGPIFTFDKKRWVDTHPIDHFADYSPQILKKIFPMYGMRLIQSWPSSYHPERFPPAFFWGKKYPSFFYKYLSRVLCYGDTMEGIAQKL